MPSRTVFAAELPWPDYQIAVKHGDTPILIPLGSMEQHGHHMPLHVDVLLPTEFARRAAIEVGGLVAPAFAYGYKSQQKSGGGNHLPGTTSLDGATLVQTLRDVIKEFARHGARKFVVVNGHFENSAFIVEGVDLALRELRWDNVYDARVMVVSYWDFVTEGTISKLYPEGFPGWAVEHGGVLETSLMLALYPQFVEIERAVDHPPATFPPYDVYPVKADWTPASGTLSSPKHASREKGEILLKVCTEGITRAIRNELAIATKSEMNLTAARRIVEIDSLSTQEGFMADDMLHIVKWHNGTKDWSPFSDQEMSRRQNDLRKYLASKNIDAALFTSYHNICYYSGFLYCYFGRKYGLVIDAEEATTVTAAIDGGQPWRRSFGDNITYTDWRRDNFFRVVQQLTKGVKRLGVEFDHLSVDYRKQIEDALPCVELVDIAQPAMWMRSIKSAEEHKLIREGARICNVGGRAVMAAVKAGVPEHEIAIASTNAMIREIAKGFPFVELMDTWTWFQSGINTDGAHNPVTNRVVRSGDILSLNCFPMVFGYYTALERTLFCDYASKAHLDLWEKNCEVHRAGSKLIRPGAKCSEIAIVLNEMYRSWGLLKYRSFGYGHSFGVLSHYYGREAGVELREDIHTELKPGMVVSMEPMIMIPEGEPGAGGYREHDIFIVTETGAENITNFPFGPSEMIIKN